MVVDGMNGTNATSLGLSNHNINSIKANKEAKTLAMEIFVPRATATGKYHMQ